MPEKPDETLRTKACNIRTKPLQHMQRPDLFLQHPYKTLTMYLWNTWNMCFATWGSPGPVESSDERQHASTTTTGATNTWLGSARRASRAMGPRWVEGGVFVLNSRQWPNNFPIKKYEHHGTHLLDHSGQHRGPRQHERPEDRTPAPNHFHIFIHILKLQVPAGKIWYSCST
jgi:hypothetical protein